MEEEEEKKDFYLGKIIRFQFPNAQIKNSNRKFKAWQGKMFEGKKELRRKRKEMKEGGEEERTDDAKINRQRMKEEEEEVRALLSREKRERLENEGGR